MGKKKNVIMPCSDANQRAKERIERKKREAELMAKRLREYMEKRKAMTEPVETTEGATTIDGLAAAKAES